MSTDLSVNRTRPAAPRLRVDDAREAEILEATLELLLEVGYDNLTMDAIALQARASKATLYRRWESKPSLILAALEASGALSRNEENTGTLRGDLLEAFCRGRWAGHASRMLAPLLTAVVTDAEFGQAYRAQVLAPKRAAFREVFARAQRRGEMRADVDVELVADVVPAMLLYRVAVTGRPVTANDIEAIIDEIVLPAVHRCGLR